MPVKITVHGPYDQNTDTNYFDKCLILFSNKFYDLDTMHKDTKILFIPLLHNKTDLVSNYVSADKSKEFIR